MSDKIPGASVELICKTVRSFHFEKLKLLENNRIDLSGYRLLKSVKKIIYKPYIVELIQTNRNLERQFGKLNTFEPIKHCMNWKQLLRVIINRLFS